MNRFKSMFNEANLPRTIITLMFLLLCVGVVAYGLPLPLYISDILVRFGMNGILVLAMVPAIQSGIGPNFGVTIGVIAGLLGTIISLDLPEWIPLPAFFTHGFGALLLALIISIPIATAVGILFGKMLNKVKGSEMIVSNYTGFSIVSIMSIGWLLIPFRKASMKWPIGDGLINVITMEETFGAFLNDLFSLKFVNVEGNTVVLFNKGVKYLQATYDKGYNIIFHIPTGLLLFFFLACYLVYLYTRSRSGIANRAVGDSMEFARASGIDVERQRVIGATLSTVLGAVGIIIFSQSFGFVQLYQAPLMMAYPAVASVLIGGATAKRATISNVIIGAFLFNGILTIALPVANQMIPQGDLSEVFRMIVQNGVILYALTKVGGKSG